MAVICDPAWPEEQTILNPPEGLRPLADAVLTDAFLERQLAHLPWDWRKKPFILDVDLDYFLTRRAAHPVDSSVFRALIECAIGITISLEPEWVRLLAFPGETHTALDLLAILDGQFGPCGE